jgi:LPS export ABC transporter protein LptC
MTRAKQLSNLFLPLAMVGIALITGCENDLKDIQKISASEVNKPIERYTGVDVIYSDSARVKAHMTAPLMIIYKTKKPYTEMPNGVKVVFYDNNLHESSTIVADYAVRHDLEKRIELDKNVVGTNIKGDTFTSDELIWDEDTKQIHSSKLVHVKMADGSITDGTGFTSDENFNHWILAQGTGKFNVKDQEISH